MTENTNPGNFANRPTEEVREIAAKGGHASHGGGASNTTTGTVSHEGRNPDGTFTKGSEAAKEAGHKGGLSAAGATTEDTGVSADGRNPDGTFTKGSEAAKEAGHKGGLA